MRKFIRARGALTVTKKFWGVLAQFLIPKADWTCETAWTDGETIGFNPSFVLSLSDPELRGLIAHEVEHVARCHHTRRGRRNSEKWNEAADYAINIDLIAGGFVLPAGGLIDSQYRNMSAEAIYARRAKEAEQQQQRTQQQAQAGQGQPQAGAGQSQPQGQPTPGQGQPTPGAGQPSSTPGQGQPQGAGAGAPGQGKPRPWGEVRDAPGGEAGKAKAEAKAAQAVKQAALVAKAEGAGNLPGSIAELIAELDRPVIDWRGVMRRFATDSTIRETSWTRPSRRYADSDFILPGAESVAPAHLVAVIDTSGSMDKRALAKAGAEIQAMLDERAVERVTVVYCDTRVHGSATFSMGDLLTLDAKGRGGTAFQPAFDWIAEHATDAAAIIYLSDLDASDRARVRDPGTPTLWVYTDPGRARPMPFGEILYLDSHA